MEKKIPIPLLKSQVQARKKKKINNPKGKGGFQDHPEIRNSTGLNKGSLSMKTKIRRAVEALAKMAGKKPEDIEDNLFIVGYNKANNGDYAFWKSIMDYIHGVVGNENTPPVVVNFSLEAEMRAKKYDDKK